MRITTINAAIVVMGIILVGTQALPLLKEDSDETEPDFFKRMKDICDDIRTRKIKKDESVIEMNGRKCRVAFITNQAFFVQRDMSRAFVATPEQVRAEVRNPHAR